MTVFKRWLSSTVRTLNAKPPGSLQKAARMEILAKYYPKDLLKSIELGESAIPEDTKFEPSKGVKFAPPYLDNFAELHPYWDYKPGLPNIHTHGPPEYFNLDEQQQPLPTELDVPRGAFLSTEGLSQTTLIAKGIQRQTGLNADFIAKNLVMRPLVMKRVSNQTAKGKIPSYYALVVVGNRDGMVGLGEGKSREDMSEAIKKAHWDAVRNLVHIPRYENRTIYGDIDYRFHGVKLFMRSAKPGSGLRVNHIIFEICECAGIKDLSAKVYKSRNRMNVAKGTLEALANSQKTLDEIALGRGKKLVDVRKVYYSTE
ncbi:HFR082Wp [Eremothecium sinecaudum]|uniref:Small ribosomal subunit protein uS5m n=1 Tax=Eremothecium sinecaudum TaxID=45286 RepID=A0A0X8HUU6_9SACH|nr:HFR082Wp [Eremothecium sinecaudum]AMD21937.1 HFR082Wp [Eremothecium sinecaudum]